MRFSFLPVIVLLMPILEIAGFIVVGKAIGVWLTLGLIVLTSMLGLILLRSGGLGILRNLRDASQKGGNPAGVIMNGGIRVIAGILLFVPGFITDIIGIALLIPAIRKIFWKAFSPRIVVAEDLGRQGFGGSSHQTRSSKVVDLDEEDFRRTGPNTGSNNSPWSRGRDDRDLPGP